jgi:glycosyltransferase involved in cell wall biosynthesis
MHHVPRRGRLVLDYARRARALRALYRDDPPAILHTWLFEANTVGIAAAQGLNGTRVVLGQRSGTMERSMRAHYAAMKLLYRRADHAIANSRAGADLLCDLGLKDSAITVVSQGVEDSRLRVARPSAEIRQTLGLPTGAPLVVAVGRADDTKDYPTLFGAMKRLGQRRPDARLVLVGPTADEIDQLALELPSGAVAVGWQESPADFMAAADVVVLSSWTEGNSNVAAEALMLGRPVATTDTGDHPRVVAEAGGRVVPIRRADLLADALDEMLTTPPEADAVRSVARQRLSVGAGFAATTAVYSRLLGRELA